MKRIISVLVEKDSGGLARIISLLTRKRFHIESIAIGACERKCYERITIIVLNKNDGVDAGKQLAKQIKKLFNVVNVKDITYLPLIERELLLVKLQVSLLERTEILNLAQIFRFKITDVTDSTIILEITADQGKVAALEKLLEKYKILELCRTGGIALIRESRVSSLSLKEYPEFKVQTGKNYLENIEDLFKNDI
uniref:Acetolactate synthase small subunit n=1 Tax=Cladosiphon okamuranus TaxID=309737 RepID=A0A6B7EYZ6_9PHAE|nr:acetolactate synthase small subunit [Cladosiphon okamuranus]QAY81068.1 acetolactate synthase small subunit [Cladosiphon okamuranus]